MVGVTADLVSTQMGNPRPQLFLPLAQQPASTVLVIARGTPSDASMRGAFANAIGGGLRMLPGRAETDAVFRELITGEWLIENSRSDILTMSAVGGIAATVALILATLGVYGVIAFMVATRTREIGIRVALGASRRRVLRDVLGSALRLVVPGIGVGLVLAVLWVRLMDPSWYPLGGVEPLRLLDRRRSGVPGRRPCRHPFGPPRGRGAADSRDEGRVAGATCPARTPCARHSPCSVGRAVVEQDSPAMGERNPAAPAMFH